MSIFTRNKRHTIFWRFLVSYLFILLIPAIIGSYIYYATIHVIEEDVKRTNLSVLQHSRDIIDICLKEVDTMVKQLALNPKVLAFLNMEALREGSPDIYKVLDVTTDLSSYKITNSFIKEFYIGSKNSKVILSSYRQYTHEAFFYGPYLKYENMTMDEWNDRILGQYHNKEYMPATTVSLEGKDYSVITYLQSIPLEYAKSYKGTIMVLIDEAEIHKLLAKLNIGDEGWFYIADMNGKVIMSYSNSDRKITIDGLNDASTEGQFVKSIDGEDTMISYTTSSINKWKYVVAVPVRYAMNKADYIRRIIVNFSLVLLLLGIIISCILAYRNVKPLRDVIIKLLASNKGETLKGINEYDFLKGTISKMMEKNQDLQSALSEQAPIVRAAFFNRLLEGGYKDIAEIRTVLSHINLEIYGVKYLVLILKIRGYEGAVSGDILKELDVARLLVKRILDKQNEEGLYTFDLDESKICILMTFQYKEHDKCRNFTEELITQTQNTLYKNYKISVVCAAGNYYDSILDSRVSYDEARQALDYISMENDFNMLWYSDIPKKPDCFYYTLGVEASLINCLKEGKAEEAEIILNKIFLENFKKRRINMHMKQLLFSSMKFTIFRFLENVRLEDEDADITATLEGIDCEEDSEQVYRKISDAYLSICSRVSRHKNDQSTKLKNEIINFVYDNFMDEGLCLCSIADRFGLTEAYLYQFFKEKIGATFASFLEDIRIKKAKELLLQTNLSIQEISQSVGYNSHYTFRRAFKRYEGIIPTDFRAGCTDNTKNVLLL